MLFARRFFYSLLSIRCQSSKTTDLINPSPSTIDKASSTDKALWATSETNRLIEQLSIRIKHAGPITVADFMREALFNSKYGYNFRYETYGKQIELISSSEVRKIFIELLATWITSEYNSSNGRVLQLVEIGSGRGIFMNEIIKLLHKEKYPVSHTFFAIYETNPNMRKIQAKNLLGQSFNPLIQNNYKIKDKDYSLIWINDLKQLLPYDTYFVGNEFFNMYPIHKFQKTQHGWKEILIDWNPITKQLQYVLSMKSTPMLRLYQNYLNTIKSRQHVEISPQRSIILQSMCKHIVAHGGSILIGDYGHLGERGDTFRAFQKDELVDPLSDPGNIDMLSDVDFQELSTHCQQIPNSIIKKYLSHFQLNISVKRTRVLVQFWGPVSQGSFLYNLGLDKRIAKLIRNKTPEEQEEIDNDIEKLVSAEYLGDRFLYICLQRAQKLNLPAGFSSPN